LHPFKSSPSHNRNGVIFNWRAPYTRGAKLVWISIATGFLVVSIGVSYLVAAAGSLR
jgi:hypothetical protein